MQQIHRYEIIFGLLGLIFFGFFVYIDLLLVNEITAAIAYVSVIGFGLLARSRRLTVLFGLLGILATICVSFTATDGVNSLILITNRQLVIMAIVTITITSHIYMTRQKEFDTTLQRIAVTDSLTGISNRRALLKEMERRISEAVRYNQDLSFILFDIDDFKAINDHYGHAAGDKVLKTLVNTCKNWLRSIDFIGRYGGEEFIVICPNTSLDGAMALAERMRIAVSGTETRFLDTTLKVTVSVGVTELYDHMHLFQNGRTDNDVLNTMINAADAAMYRAKQKGKNCVIPHIVAEEVTVKRNTA